MRSLNWKLIYVIFKPAETVFEAQKLLIQKHFNESFLAVMTSQGNYRLRTQLKHK